MCPKCGSDEVEPANESSPGARIEMVCTDCLHTWGMDKDDDNFDDAFDVDQDDEFEPFEHDDDE